MQTKTKNSPIISITMDDREKDSGVLEHLEAIPEVVTEVRRLRIGDYSVDGDFIIERKTVVDFAISVVDGRLFRQACAMANSECRTCFVLEGSLDDLAPLDITCRSVLGALATTSLVFDQPVLLSRCTRETAWVIVSAARQLRRREAHRVPRFVRKVTSIDRIRSNILQGVPGIGPDKAGALLIEFEDILGVVRASISDLARVPGIGPKTARRLHEAFIADPAKPPL